MKTATKEFKVGYVGNNGKDEEGTLQILGNKVVFRWEDGAVSEGTLKKNYLVWACPLMDEDISMQDILDSYCFSN